jgi:post-segregation antitoxin (ccd killing protein)
MNNDEKQQLRSELDRQQAQNAKLRQMLEKIQQLWPEDEKEAVHRLASQVEATGTILQQSDEMLRRISG